MEDTFRTFVQTITAICLMTFALAIWQRDTLIQWKIESDLRNYASATRRADLPLSEKEQLLDQIDAIETCLSEGGSASYFDWRLTDQAIREMCRCGITPDEAILIGRELRKSEKSIG